MYLTRGMSIEPKLSPLFCFLIRDYISLNLFVNGPPTVNAHRDFWHGALLDESDAITSNDRSSLL